jgi:hypothetical protein
MAKTMGGNNKSSGCWRILFKRRKQTGSDIKIKPKCNNNYDLPWKYSHVIASIEIIRNPERLWKHSTQTLDHVIFQCKILKTEIEFLKNGVLKVDRCIWPVSKGRLSSRYLKQLNRYTKSMDLEKINNSNEQM